MTEDIATTATLQLVRLKGRVTADALAGSLALSPADARRILEELRVQEAVTETNGQMRLSPKGRELLAARIATERGSVDQTRLAEEYQEFHHLNSEFKELVTAWQIHDDAPNDHQDAAYDGSVIDRLRDLDARFTPQVARLGELAPRLRSYPTRFAEALRNLSAGDNAWFARPILDSYHTVWFELHEDLIGLLGLSRNAEAEAGRA